MAKALAKSRAVAAAAEGTSGTPQGTITTDDIARRAYDLYVARGREDGHDVEDWLEAERELRGAERSLVAVPMTPVPSPLETMAGSPRGES